MKNTNLRFSLALATKYSITQVNDLLAPKADSVFVNSQLALKADDSALDVVKLGLTTKANQTTTYTNDETNNLLQKAVSKSIH